MTLQVFPCSKVIFNIRTNATSQLKSVKSTFRTGKNGGKTAEDIDERNEHYMEIAETLGEKMATTIDLTKWKTDVNVFNSLAGWLGFQNCHFTSIVHENVNGYGRDKMTNIGIDARKCQPP